jgi:hypothetical protein
MCQLFECHVESTFKERVPPSKIVVVPNEESAYELMA